MLIAFAAALLGTIYWWNSLPREMFFYGMIGFPIASYLIILGVSLIYRIANKGRILTPVHFGWLLFAIVVLPLDHDQPRTRASKSRSRQKKQRRERVTTLSRPSHRLDTQRMNGK